MGISLAIWAVVFTVVSLVGATITNNALNSGSSAYDHSDTTSKWLMAGLVLYLLIILGPAVVAHYQDMLGGLETAITNPR